MTSLVDIYQEKLNSQAWQAHPAQKAIVQHLAQQMQTLSTRKHWFSSQKPVYGTYLWGPVGTGKSCLMQWLYQHSNIRRKVFWTGSQLLAQIQQQLLPLHGEKNPIQIVAKRLAKQFRLICIDEFEIKDISAVMLIGPVIQTLIQRHTCLIITSNQPITGLYPNGLQRNHLLPTLRMMQQHLSELQLGGIDHRQHQLGPGQYWLNLDENQQDFSQFFTKKNLEITDLPWPMHPHPMPVRGRAPGVLWVDLKAICASPRCQTDYPLIATQIHTLILTGLKAFPKDQFNHVTNFIALIDCLYAHQVRLIISANCPIDALCPAGLMAETFKRTASRLQGMCTTTMR